MDFFKGLTGASSSDPPASVLAEWNKYSTGDIESGGASTSQPQQPSFLANFLQQSLQPSNNASSGTNTASASMAMYGTTGRGEGWSSQSFRCVADPHHNPHHNLVAYPHHNLQSSSYFSYLLCAL